MKIFRVPELSGLTLVAFMSVFMMSGETVAASKKCLFVSSYHKGYEHADHIEAGLRATLAGHCEIRQFDMDSKRHSAEAEKRASALEAKAIIESWKPDVVITADDNAIKYLVKPYYKDAKIPFVFCGLNWTAAEYGLPYSNATGMIEVAPVAAMLERSRRIVKGFRRAFYVGADILSETKNLKRFQDAAAQMGFKLDYALAGTTEAWVEAYTRAQEYDLVIMGSRNGVKNWDHEMALAAVMKHTRKLSVTNHGWMMPYTILGMTKVSREQGEWAGEIAVKILDGARPADIPVVPNRQRDIWVNENILSASGLQLPHELMRKGKRIAGIAN